MFRLTAVLLAFVAFFLALVVDEREARARQSVDLELLLALDTSNSVDSTEYLLQQRGLALAFQHPAVHRAIAAAGGQGIAVSVMQWAGSFSQRTVIGWVYIRTPEEARAFAGELLRMPRMINGLTDVSGAVDHGVASILTNNFDGRRLVIDVSGDGVSPPFRTRAARDRAAAVGIVINGLAIHSRHEYDLGVLARLGLSQHYLNDLITGPGAFLVSAEGYKDFRDAIRRKLIREISGAAVARR